MSWFSTPPVPTYYDDEKSPVDIEDYRTLREEMFQQIEVLKNSGLMNYNFFFNNLLIELDWIYVDQGVPGVNFYKKQVDGYPVEMLRIETEVSF